jgi:hypothetical protein
MSRHVEAGEQGKWLGVRAFAPRSRIARTIQARLLVFLALAGFGQTRDGLIVLSPQALPIPGDAWHSPVPGAGFEAAWPSFVSTTPVAEFANEGAPEGTRFAHLTGENLHLNIGPLAARPGLPHRFSMWIRAEEPFSLRLGDEPQNELPHTRNAWRKLALYFVQPTTATDCRLELRSQTALAFDAPALRSATWDELAEAYAREHENYPAHDTIHSTDAGLHLANSVAMWQGKGPPGRPFSICAVGPSWPAELGNGLPLLLAIRRNFPNAPPLTFASASDGTITTPPDLVLACGADDNLLRELREQSTADIMLASLPDGPSLEAICQAHGAQFVAFHREFADYLTRHKLSASDIDPPHFRIRFWDAFCQRIARHPDAKADPRIRRVPISDVRTADGGRRIHLPFTGHRVDILAQRQPGAGRAFVFIDSDHAAKARFAVPGRHIHLKPQVREQIGFAGTGSASQTIVTGLPNGPHTLDLVIQGDAQIEAFYIYTPTLP